MIFKYIALAFVGMSSGFLVSAGIFAYIAMIGIVPRLTAKTDTAGYVRWYETAIILGGSLGNIFYIFKIKFYLWIIGVVLYGLGAGIFVGCLAVALAEVLKTFPIFSMRIKLRWGIPYVALALSLGKMFGSLYGLVFS